MDQQPRCEPVGAAGLLALIGELHPLFRACFAEAPWYESAERLDAFPARMARMTAHPGACGYLVREQGRIVGAAFGWPMPAVLATGSAEDAAVAAAAPPLLAAKLAAPAFQLAKLMVSPAHRRRGIGRSLLSAITAQHGLVWLSTHPLAPAVALYEAEGWRRQFTYAIGGLPLVVLLKQR